MLRVPLQARRLPKHGLEHIEIWQNGKSIIEPSPIWPYFISEKGIILEATEFKEEQIKFKDILSLEEKNGWKYSFPEVEYIAKFNRLIRNHPNEKFVYENHIGFLERIAIDRPDWFTQWPEKLDSHLTFDIETASENYIQSKHIIACGLTDGTEEPWCHTGNEIDILENFIRDWKKIDPDEVVTYNGKFFDLPVIMERCKYHGIDLNWINRTTKKPKQDENGRVHKLQGRVMFDVWEQVDSDQTLFGIKNRRLKTVGKWFKQDVIEEELFSTVDLLDDVDRLVRYCNSDVRLTEYLYQIYRFGLIQIANTLKFPYDLIVNPPGGKGKVKSKAGRSREGTSTFIGRLISGRGMKSGQFVECGQNRHKYSDIYMRERGNYQGAIVEIYKTGTFKNILHVDYSGMYPSIQISANLSPETTKIISLTEYNINAPIVKEKGKDYTIFEIADSQIYGCGKNVIIRVDQTQIGSLPQTLIDVRDHRQKIKDLEKESKKNNRKDDELKYWSQQYGLKIIANACGYGSMAPPEVRYGSIAVAIMITGIGRYMLNIAREYIKQYYDLIELDTDGIYIDYGKDEDPSEFIDNLNNRIKTEVSKFSINAEMKMSADRYLAGFFYKQKNYVLKTLKGELKWKGVAFKSASKPSMYDEIRDDLAEFRLRNASKEEVRLYLKDVMRIEKWNMPSLTMRTTITKYPSQYKNVNLGKRLSMMAEKFLGQKALPHTQYEYVFCKPGFQVKPPTFDKLINLGFNININKDSVLTTENYLLAALADHTVLDYRRYRQMIAELASTFGYGEEITGGLVRDPGINPITSWM